MTKILLSKQLEDYAARYTTPELACLARLNRETNVKRGDAIMLSGHMQGALLQMLSHMIRPKCILEIGTFTGYSAICLAQGLQQGGILHTIEIDEELHDIGAKYIAEAGLADKIMQHTGKAAEIIPGIADSFDLVFIDADKSGYSTYYDLVFPKVPVGGFIIADNVLYEGDVILPEEEQGKNALAMHRYNQKITTDNRVEHVLMPLRDGLMVVRKVMD
ncbi:MAG: O-methyltransferase [Bacteroidota bacterium]